MIPDPSTKAAEEPFRAVAFGTGLIALDVIIDSETTVKPTLVAGGTCGNVLASLAFFGWTSYPVARLNGDAASRILQEDLAGWGVELKFATQVPQRSTPIIVQTTRRDARGVPKHSFSSVCPECGGWFPRFQAVRQESADAVLRCLPEKSPLRGAQVFFFDRVSRASLTLAEQFAADGALVVFEPSGVGKENLFEEALRLAHVLKYSRERMPRLSARPPMGPERLLEIETRSADGLMYRSPLTSWSWQFRKAIGGGPAIVDSAGAGDWCTAGLLAVLGHRGLSQLLGASREEVEAALDFGQAAAAIACGFSGPRGAMYTLGVERFRQAIDAALNGEVRPCLYTSDCGSATRIPHSSAITEICPSCA